MQMCIDNDKNKVKLWDITQFFLLIDANMIAKFKFLIEKEVCR